jgi:hypothetical protein
MNLLSLLTESVPNAQTKINRPLVSLLDLINLAHKGEAIPIVAKPAQKMDNSLSSILPAVQNTTDAINKPINAIGNAVDHTIGLGFIKDWAQKNGMVDTNSFDASPLGVLRYAWEHRNDPDAPNMTLDTNGMLPAPYQYKGNPTFKMGDGSN